MIPFAIKANGFFENIKSIRARVLIVNDMEWLKNIRYGNIQSDAYYNALFLPPSRTCREWKLAGSAPT